ncbi:MAG: crossover junction endodeoxyribonuclease RuvC [Cytophagales bacterium]|nr:crossover junction endodeoxyribonuclease RuvC [Cytophagales bacterium]
MLVLGIDPGSRVLGYALLRGQGSALLLEQAGVFRLARYEDGYPRWRELFLGVGDLMKTYSPEQTALEAPFYGRNVQSMLKLGRAQGMVIAASILHEIPFSEYSPRQVKKSVTGRGSASKEQVAGMLGRLMKLPSNLPLDATDAIAVGVCHLFNTKI